jgi:hypothetical protein
MTRSIWIVAVLAGSFVPTLSGQARLAPSFQPSAISADGRRLMADGQRASFRHAVVHYGKWLTAAGAVALTYLAAEEHQQSRREWNSLLAICRSARDACTLGPNGTYQRGDAESLYQISRRHDKKANQWLFAAQAALFTTTALFIIDLHPGQGPGNIPYPSELRVGGVGTGTGVELRLAF